MIDESFCSLTQWMNMECRDVKVFLASIDVQQITAVIATIAEASKASEISPTRVRRTRAEKKVVAIAVIAANYTYLQNDCSPPLPAIFNFFSQILCCSFPASPPVHCRCTMQGILLNPVDPNIVPHSVISRPFVFQKSVYLIDCKSEGLPSSTSLGFLLSTIASAGMRGRHENAPRTCCPVRSGTSRPSSSTKSLSLKKRFEVFSNNVVSITCWDQSPYGYLPPCQRRPGLKILLHRNNPPPVLSSAPIV